MAEEKKKTRLSSINIDGVKYLTNLTESFRNRKKYQEKDPDKILAVIPGTIVEVKVKKGNKVQEGDVLLILEAMKMRNAVVAPHDGTVVKVTVKNGDIIPKGHMMVELGSKN